MASADDEMRIGTHNGHLMVAALRRHHDKPVIHLGDVTLTGKQVTDRISQYVQAFESLNAGQGTAGALLALNRPEVLFILGASQTQGYRRTSLHPLGSLDDHAYVINDAEITTLIVDPLFVERALGLLDKCPGLKQVLTIGPVPDALIAVGEDLIAAAEQFEPQPLEAVLLAKRPHDLDHLHRRHDRQPQGRDRPGRVVLDDDQHPARRVGVAGEPALPHVHPAVPRRRRVLRAGRDQGRLALRDVEVRPGRGPRVHRDEQDPGHDAGALDAVRADGPSRLAHPRPEQPRDGLLRRQRDQPGPAQGGHRPVRADLRSVLRPVRGADGHHVPGQAGPRDRRRREAVVVRPTVGVHPHGAPRRGGQPGEAGRTGGDLRGRTAAVRRLLEAAGRHRRDVPGRLDAHRRRGPRGRGRLLVHRRPDQGHDRHRRLQRVPARGRGRRRRAPGDRPGRRDRHARREVG